MAKEINRINYIHVPIPSSDPSYATLMRVANDPKLMDTFYIMLTEHYNKHREVDTCYFCKIYAFW